MQENINIKLSVIDMVPFALQATRHRGINALTPNVDISKSLSKLPSASPLPPLSNGILVTWFPRGYYAFILKSPL